MKQDPTVAVSSNDYLKAEHRWCSFTGLGIRAFANWLGMSQVPGSVAVMFRPHTMWIRGSAAHKIRMLCSPHYQTILKAAEARKSG